MVKQVLTDKKLENKELQFTCKNWTKEQCEQFLNIDLWDTQKWLNKRIKEIQKKDIPESKKEIELSNLNWGKISLRAIALGAIARFGELTKEDLNYVKLKLRIEKEL